MLDRSSGPINSNEALTLNLTNNLLAFKMYNPGLDDLVDSSVRSIFDEFLRFVT